MPRCGRLTARLAATMTRPKDVRAIRGFGGRPNRKAVVRAGRRLYKRLRARVQRRHGKAEIAAQNEEQP